MSTRRERIEAAIERLILRKYGRIVADRLAAQDQFTPEQDAVIEEILDEEFVEPAP